ncbi:zinc finger protein 626-like [Achroia grisella]|uniref:zinc finger protein 626-like n=1 Tax=Achroia grisella TaxID=688607 RepID=UPI0027D30E1B|nr:zinc finger protein 626-like [Achroia grisella]
MASIINHCRLCAKKEELLKDLLDVNNKSVFKSIQDFIQIAVVENDVLPTKICLNCEEKIVSFQLFILECYKAQDTLKSIYLDNFNIKHEDESLLYNSSVIKSEVKDEFTPEDIVLDHIDTRISEYDGADFSEFDDHKNDDSDEDPDNITLASLKKEKRKRIKKKTISEEDAADFKELLKKSYLKANDFVKLHCDMCDVKMKSWSELTVHYGKIHKSKPYLNCICGYVINSKSVLYKHVSDHKLESRKLHNTSQDIGKPSNVNYSSLKIRDFVDFTCNICKKKYTSWYSLKSHTSQRHKIMPIVKCICGITLKSKSVLYKHIQDHRNPNVLSCDKCPRITKTIEALNKHKMRHIPKSERKFYCNSCDKVFNTKDGLKSHSKSHIPVEERKIYHCDVCDLKFTTRSSAASHKRVVHDKIKSYICDLCGYACGTSGELRQHRAIHSDDKPYVCGKCFKPFKTHSNLKTHIDTHEDTSYTCGVCNRVLNSRRTLRKHLLVHEEKCRHVCSYCHKAFKRSQTLKVHLYTHTGDKPLSCKWCNERFAYASTLRSHRLRCHPDKLAQPAHTYQPYRHLSTQQDYIKNDLAVINGAKNETEAM